MHKVYFIIEQKNAENIPNNIIDKNLYGKGQKWSGTTESHFCRK